MFQYHLIIFILILCIPSLGIILPINYTGDVLGRWSSVDPEPGPLDLKRQPSWWDRAWGLGISNSNF